MVAFDALYDPDFLQALQQFQLRARQVPRGGRYAEQVSRAMGQGMEFRDFRPYNAGDDLRAVDWNIYRRLGRVFVKLFEEQRDLPIYLMVDVSASMFMEDRPRIKPALQCALAFAAIGLSQHDNITLLPFSNELHTLTKAKAGKAGLMGFARRLSELFPPPPSPPPRSSTTDLPVALRHLSGMSVRRGLLVVISDFFDEGGVDEVIKSLGACRHRLLLVQLVRASDETPQHLGDVRLVDCENGQEVELSITSDVVQKYQKIYRSFNKKLSDFAASRGAELVQLDAERDVLPQLSALFQSSGKSGSMRV